MFLPGQTKFPVSRCIWLTEEDPEGAVADGWSKSAVGTRRGGHETSGSGWTTAERSAANKHPQVIQTGWQHLLTAVYPWSHRGQREGITATSCGCLLTRLFQFHENIYGLLWSTYSKSISIDLTSQSALQFWSYSPIHTSSHMDVKRLPYIHFHRAWCVYTVFESVKKPVKMFVDADCCNQASESICWTSEIWNEQPENSLWNVCNWGNPINLKIY